MCNKPVLVQEEHKQYKGIVKQVCNHRKQQVFGPPIHVTKQHAEQKPRYKTIELKVNSTKGKGTNTNSQMDVFGKLMTKILDQTSKK